MKSKFFTPDRLVLIGYAGVAIAYTILFYVKYRSHSSTK